MANTKTRAGDFPPNVKLTDLGPEREGYGIGVTIENDPVSHPVPVGGTVRVEQPFFDQLRATILDTWRVALVSNEGGNDSDKTITVTAGQEWQILWIWVEFISTATAGDRQLVIEIQDNAADVIGQVATAGIVQTASLTRNYLFAPAMSDMTAFRDTNFLSCPIPPTLFLKAGDVIRIYDNNAVDAAADDMVIQMQYAWRAV